MASSSGVNNNNNRVMEKPGQELVQQQQQALRCPRCDSSNTKFCYYNNYSLSQPRHFCKACKRYWTRGGTLRNVPVGGGCRKNKRVKRPNHSSSSSNIHSPSSSTPTSVTANSNPSSQQQHHSFDLASTSNHINTLLYGNSCHDVMNFPFSTRFNSTRVSTSGSGSGYDHLQQNGLGLGFSSGLTNLNHHHDDYRNGFSTSSNNNNNYSSIFGSSSMSSTTPVMNSLLSSTLLQQKFMSTVGGGGNGNGGMKGDLFHHHDMKMEGNSRSDEVEMMGSKEGLNRLDQWNNNNHMNGSNGTVAFQNQMENMGLSDSSSSLYWNNSNNNIETTGLGSSVWSTDQPNTIGPNSVTSLI
jgi:hypothetical protein